MSTVDGETSYRTNDLMIRPTGNYVNMLGYGDNHDLTEYLRLYIALHGDHEGGNASAHTSRKSAS